MFKVNVKCCPSSRLGLRSALSPLTACTKHGSVRRRYIVKYGQCLGKQLTRSCSFNLFHGRLLHCSLSSGALETENIRPSYLTDKQPARLQSTTENLAQRSQGSATSIYIMSYARFKCHSQLCPVPFSHYSTFRIPAFSYVKATRDVHPLPISRVVAKSNGHSITSRLSPREGLSSILSTTSRLCIGKQERKQY